MWCVAIRLTFFSFIQVFSLLGSWVVLVVRVGHSPSNPSPSLCLLFISPFMGVLGLSDLWQGKGYRGDGLWGKVRDSWESTWEVVCS
ncbi:hypothetical protein Tco_0259101 [Tanacetum coccineum]